MKRRRVSLDSRPVPSEGRECLKAIGVDGVTVSEVLNHSRQEDHTETYRSQEYTVDLHPKMKLELVTPDTRLDEIVDTLSAAARTGNRFGQAGDGKIFVSSIDDAICIRCGNHGEGALD